MIDTSGPSRSTFPTSVSEPIRFSFDEDEPMPMPMPPAPTSSSSQKVTVKSIPERLAVASSDSVSQFTVLVGLKAPPSLSQNARAPIDLVTVLDVSLSMSGHKLTLLKQAVRFVIHNLGPCDRLSVVSFSDRAQRLFPLRRMTENGRVDAEKAVNTLSVIGTTNIVEGLEMGVRVLDERRYKNPVTSIIFLSDGIDTHHSLPFNYYANNLTCRPAPEYLHLLPDAIFPKDKGQEDLQTIPVHSFGFGSDHDPVTMHAISEASGGTFSFIESYTMVQDAFASCIGGLMSVVAQELRLNVRSASHGVDILYISSGRYANEISKEGSEGLISVADLYADEEKDFLINLFVPKQEANDDKTSLLDISCSYREVVSKEVVTIEGDNLVEIRRPEIVSPVDMVVNLEVDRQRNLIYAVESIGEAQKMAEKGNLADARSLLAERRSYVRGSLSGQAGDGLCKWMEKDMKETEMRFGSKETYFGAGQAFALSGMSSYGMQRATTRGNAVPGAATSYNIGSGGAASSFIFGTGGGGALSSPFGNSGAASSFLFGSGGGAASSSLFGAAASSSVFSSGGGAASSSLFGAVASSSVFGSGGGAASSSLFGAAASSSVFGSGGGAASSSLFGAAASSSVFGSADGAASSSLFGCVNAASSFSFSCGGGDATPMDVCFSGGGGGSSPSFGFGGGEADPSSSFSGTGGDGAPRFGFGGAFVTPSMVSMVNKSQNHKGQHLRRLTAYLEK